MSKIGKRASCFRSTKKRIYNLVYYIRTFKPLDYQTISLYIVLFKDITSLVYSLTVLEKTSRKMINKISEKIVFRINYDLHLPHPILSET